ncbi:MULTISPECIES: phenylalanine 4-monooxygenase [unclassified Chelatococcus]|uniref:phenylalanine 4-monooxygenase n=1 Tax=unclassified Chelatococcus TaxID=2638111 RepID=UPI0002F72CD4|nr:MULTISPECIES: phenylalanine 4-monooxygenase [unclassified Chelatococcus]ALA18714.1 phenylalanine-4-hydroxylase [Chelatococcus sp. CO-6]
MSTHAVLNAQSVEDCIIAQDWERYSAEDHATWGILFERQRKTLEGHICQEYLDGLAALGIGPEGVPDFRAMNERLRRLTGWEVVAVPGLIPSRPFFQMLSDRRFPTGTFIRSRAQLDYLEEPDIFHDVFGHVPLLTNPAYADYMREYGRTGLVACDNKGVKFLARLNWYTIEFGLIRKPEGIKAYGAGIASSYGEAKYVVEDPSANFLAFDLERVLRTGYYIDDFQATYFVIDRFEDLFALMRQTDFLELYTRLRTEPELTPFEIGPEDVVVREGTGEYWREFPQAKAHLK